jgi:hypothetical protein
MRKARVDNIYLPCALDDLMRLYTKKWFRVRIFMSKLDAIFKDRGRKKNYNNDLRKKMLTVNETTDAWCRQIDIIRYKVNV